MSHSTSVLCPAVHIVKCVRPPLKRPTFCCMTAYAQPAARDVGVGVFVYVGVLVYVEVCMCVYVGECVHVCVCVCRRLFVQELSYMCRCKTFRSSMCMHIVHA